MDKINIYLDDYRIPVSPMHGIGEWELYKNYNDVVNRLEKLSYVDIGIISLDHDLGPVAMKHFFNHVIVNGNIDYKHLHDNNELTGYDVALYLIDRSFKTKEILPPVLTHSANPIGTANIMSVINLHYYKNKQHQVCTRWRPDIINKDNQ